jgi:hypothetical protein
MELAVRFELTIPGFAGRCLLRLGYACSENFGSKKLAGLVGLKPTTCRLEAGRSHSSELQARKAMMNAECGMMNEKQVVFHSSFIPQSSSFVSGGGKSRTCDRAVIIRLLCL